MAIAKEAPQERRRIKEMEVMIADVVQETPDTATLVLFTGNDQLVYRAGHFLTIDPHQFEDLARFIQFFEELKGKREPARAYSMASAPHEKYLSVTIKEEPYLTGVTKYPPLLSPLLVRRMTRGMRLVVTGFTGPYTLPDEIESITDHVVHVCAGSGVVPNFSILKHALHAHPKLRHTFILSNKTWADVIFRRELHRISGQFPEQVWVVHALTREDSRPATFHEVHSGRVDRELLARLIPDPTACVFFVCGPGISPWDRARAKEQGGKPAPRFLESVLALLGEIGVPKNRIKHESYG